MSAAVSPSARVTLDTTPFKEPARPAAGEPDVSTLGVLIEPVAYDSIAPAELLVMDAQGRRIGAEPGSWRALLEAPGAEYDSLPPVTQLDGDREPGGLNKQLYHVTPPAGHYALQVIGRRDGSYKLTVTLTTPRAEARVAKVTRPIRAGEVHVYRFTHDDKTGPLELKPER